MEILPTPLNGVFLTRSSTISDNRGRFSRLFCMDEMRLAIGKRNIVQINQSVTARVGAIRGMHFQNAPFAELKVVRCLRGRVFDVAVDLRKGSPTFLQWFGCELSGQSSAALVIPEGCAHGFQALEPDSELLYLHTNFYTPRSEGGVRFDDPLLSIRWPLSPEDLSQRDLNHALLTENFQGLVA